MAVLCVVEPRTAAKRALTPVGVLHPFPDLVIDVVEAKSIGLERADKDECEHPLTYRSWCLYQARCAPRSSGKFGPTCAVAYKITNGLVAQFVTMASAAADWRIIAGSGR